MWACLRRDILPVSSLMYSATGVLDSSLRRCALKRKRLPVRSEARASQARQRPEPVTPESECQGCSNAACDMHVGVSTLATSVLGCQWMNRMFSESFRVHVRVRDARHSAKCRVPAAQYEIRTPLRPGYLDTDHPTPDTVARCGSRAVQRTATIPPRTSSHIMSQAAVGRIRCSKGTQAASLLARSPRPRLTHAHAPPPRLRRM